MRDLARDLKRGRATQRRSHQGQPWRHRGRPRKSEARFGRSRSCSWFVEIAGIGLRCTRNLAKAGNEGSTPKPGALVGRRRCPLTRRRHRQAWCPSLEGHDRERQRLVPDRPLAENATGRERSAEGSRSRAHRSERRWHRGKPRRIAGQAKARGSPSSEALPEVTSFAGLTLGGR